MSDASPKGYGPAPRLVRGKGAKEPGDLGRAKGKGKTGESFADMTATLDQDDGSPLTTITANLLSLPLFFLIIHQCNCLSHGPAKGLAAAVFARFPDADVYSKRAQGQRGPDKPGTISQHGRIVNLYGQWFPGVANSRLDNAEQRLKWFKQGLVELASKLRSETTLCIAFPENIGCGLAGGSWPLYKAEIRQWAEQHPNWQCVIVVRP